MRLTLRTLLAYLDNTLEPQDAEVLRTKLSESGFATQLVTRIRSSLMNANLSAPSPEAVSPVEEANVICEYLDSTLNPEQVAEIERACLESETHLAEAAACHQILTMVLGQPAEVSPQLRRRVYELPDRELKDIPVAGSFSSLEIPASAGSPFDPDLPRSPSSLSNPDDIQTLDQPLTQAGRMVHPSEPVAPVGLTDSGVSDAPTRLREAGVLAANGAPSPRSRSAGSIQRSDMYSGSIRPSRITPWLVSLALAGVLLFALAQIFSPLLRSRTASKNIDSEDVDEILVSPENAPPMIEVESQPSRSESIENAEALPAPSGDSVVSIEMTEDVANEETIGIADIAVDDMPPPMPSELVPSDLAPPAPSDLAATKEIGNEIGGGNDPVMKPLESAEQPNNTSVAVMTADVPTNAAADIDAAKTETDPAGTESTEAEKTNKGTPAKILSENTILAGRVADGDWIRLNRGATIGAGVSIACAPLFQGHITSEAGVDIVLVGSTNVTWESGTDDLPAVIAIDGGRMLIGSLQEDVQIGIRFGDDIVKVALADPEAVLAVTRSSFRAAGFDPLSPQNHVATTSILAVQGNAKLTFDGAITELTTGDLWKRRGDRDAEVEQIETAPAWIENPDAEYEEVYTLARDTLLELIPSDQPFEKSLREATMFRRSEVAALAGRALLSMGSGDVYFGGDGLLSQADQRNYWADHYRALMDKIDQSSETANELLASIGEMESTDADTIYRLLVGYSQKQLVEGSDEKLVNLLDSNSMAVRVLARENLRTITGISLNFKPENDNAVRRAPEIKKWLVRLRKGDIRWQQTP